MDNNWIIEHIDHLIENRREEARTLLLTKLPKRLFKYRRLNKYTIDSLRNNAVWMSKITELNDPYECYPKLEIEVAMKNFFTSKTFRLIFKERFGKDITNDEYSAIVSSKDMMLTYKTIAKSKGITAPSYDEAILGTKEIFSKEILSLRKNIRLCSFSETIESVIMWSHYADEHKGICIEYDFIDFDDDLLHLYPVSYTNELFDFTPAFSGTYRKHLFALASLQKGEDWRYEQEWRIVYPFDPSRTSGYVRAPKPTAIYFGSRFSENQPEIINELKEYISRNNIVTYDTQMHPAQYKITTPLNH